jgi:hypothetical protein
MVDPLLLVVLLLVLVLLLALKLALLLVAAQLVPASEPQHSLWPAWAVSVA